VKAAGSSPAVIKRLTRWRDVQTLSVVALIVLVLGNRLGDLGGRLPNRIAIPLATAPFAAYMAAAVLHRRGWRRLRREYSSSGGRLCTGCGHTLGGLGEVGTCPECGQSFDIPRDRTAWHAHSLGKLPEHIT
jgi:hypothetical protein